MFRQGVFLAFQVMLAVCLAGPAEERIVYPRVLEGRGLRGEKMLYIHDGLTLSLQKSRVFAENFVLTVDDGLTQTDKIMRGEDLGNNLYHDEQGTAALQVEDANGTVQVTGFLEHTLAIEPLPLIARSGDGRIAHKLSEIDYEAQARRPPSYPPPPPYSVVDVAQLEMSSALKSDDSSPNVVEQRVKKVPEEFLVETRIISDHHMNKGKTEKELIDYYGVRMNLVNHHFKQVTAPRVKFLTVGIVLSKKEPYARVVQDTKKNRTSTLLYDTLKYLVDTLNRTGQHKKQDAVVFNTGLVPATTQKNGTVYYGVVGIAPMVGGVCSMYGVTTLALEGRNPMRSSKLIGHELAHVVGVNHEGGGKKGLRCPKNGDGYLMGARGPKAFSKCSIEEIRRRASTLSEECFKLTAGPIEI
ncbi:putative metalloprotease [Ixodes scapularis]